MNQKRLQRYVVHEQRCGRAPDLCKRQSLKFPETLTFVYVCKFSLDQIEDRVQPEKNSLAWFIITSLVIMVNTSWTLTATLAIMGTTSWALTATRIRNAVVIAVGNNKFVIVHSSQKVNSWPHGFPLTAWPSGLGMFYVTNSWRNLVRKPFPCFTQITVYDRPHGWQHQFPSWTPFHDHKTVMRSILYWH